MRSNLQEFADVIRTVGTRPADSADQHATRHYSETLSKALAHWIRDALLARGLGDQVLRPEAKIKTIDDKKALDVGVLDERGYLVLDVSIKTFNFKRKKGNGGYSHNFTGRFYELLGEELALRRSYRWATLVALVFLPEDSTVDGKRTSSFANAVKRYSKIAAPAQQDVAGARFEHVFIGLHDKNSRIYFFDAGMMPPQMGPPDAAHRLSFEQMLECVASTVQARSGNLAADTLPNHTRFRFAKPTV